MKTKATFLKSSKTHDGAKLKELVMSIRPEHKWYTNRQMGREWVPPWPRAGEGDNILDKYATRRSSKEKVAEGSLEGN